MRWDDTKDLVLCKEILVVFPFRYKERTQCRGSAWKRVAANLKEKTDLFFKLDARSVRDRWHCLKNRTKDRIEKEICDGIMPELTELDTLLRDLIKQDTTDSEEKKSDQFAEAKIIMDEMALRKRMAIINEPRKRPIEDDSEQGSSKRQNQEDTSSIEYLRLKIESDARIKQEELELKKREQEIAQEAQQQIIQQIIQQQNSMLTMMGQQMELTRQLLLVLSKKT
ncbi:uncharacterized protein [Antedon mediterranea]